MPKGPVPDRYHDLLMGTALGHLASVSAAGKPQVNPVWFIFDRDAGLLLLSVKPETNTYRNFAADGGVAMSVLDPDRTGRYVELRGTVAELELFDSLSWVNRLARKYTGADVAHGRDGELRYKVTVRVDAWTGQG